MEQWRQFDIMMIMAIIILPMDIGKQNLVLVYDIGYDAATDIDGMCYASVIVSLHATPKKITKNIIRKTARGGTFYGIFQLGTGA